MTGRYQSDFAATRRFLDVGEQMLGTLSTTQRHSRPQDPRARAVHQACRTVRLAFLAVHADQLYAELTDGRRRHLRVDVLCTAAGELMPGLVPTAEQLAEEGRYQQPRKEGREIDQGLLLWSVLRSPGSGAHLMEAMARPTPRASTLLPAFRADGFVDLGEVTVERRAGVGHVTVQNQRCLNAEDDAVVEALETAVDLVLLDDDVRVGVLRGGVMRHPRYAGRRVFSAGINLTELYRGGITFLGFLMRREMGYIAKMVRGLAPDPDDPTRRPAAEKPWVGAVDTFAIGGGLQILLAADHVVAEKDAYFSLPALREGLVPGVANLRLPRLVPSRRARKAIFSDHTIRAGDTDGALLCDAVVDADEMAEAVASAAARLADPAVVPNRRMLRLAEEPEDRFRQYLAEYALEQSRRIYSEDLFAKLEQTWLARFGSIVAGTKP
ncbi:enoyl-CoA hydratase/isomerase family protein [Micromonospora noduli]|uniref:enoyl-CoA hydratase/isomerase family protein n=1 Tax=Micromonospora noduli TaxID=709876 RepID=UPI000DBFACCA|nr:enoyl-CoA hydratase/isomerase family protein [Micromonospora noduli]RAO12510.1 (3,5-dihydroxyphenyl)acetyl-CoA 1,2-dioxygenase [Micromonospora noduli]